MTKRLLLASTGIAISTALLCGPVAATAATAATATPAKATQSLTLSTWSAADRREVAERARTAGDLDGAAVSMEMAAHVDAGIPVERADSRNIWTTIAKKAVIQALRYGVNKLPAKMRPYVNKIIDVVEEIDQFQQGAVVLALTKVGVPYDVAVTAAQWIVVFVGL